MKQPIDVTIDTIATTNNRGYPISFNDFKTCLLFPLEKQFVVRVTHSFHTVGGGNEHRISDTRKRGNQSNPNKTIATRDLQLGWWSFWLNALRDWLCQEYNSGSITNTNAATN